MNNVQFEGNLARDIEISFSKNGMAVARETVACNRTGQRIRGLGNTC